MRTSSGCWTCRVRRKKCDQKRPTCEACASLSITCHFDLNTKPPWMDGGARQDEMAEKFKVEVKQKLRYRLGKRPTQGPNERPLHDPAATLMSRETMTEIPIKSSYSPESLNHHEDIGTGPLGCSIVDRTQPRVDRSLLKKEASPRMPFERSEAVLLMFYLETLYPFLFPVYYPSPLQGSRAWILEMMTSSQVVRQAILCQSSYFFDVARGSPGYDADSKDVLAQTTGAIEVLRESMQVINSSCIGDNIHGATRIMASIMQMQCFEVIIMGSQNWQAHHDGAMALLKQVLDSPPNCKGRIACYHAVMDSLGPSPASFPTNWTGQNEPVWSAEQSAFKFVSSLFLYGDTIAGIARQKRPRLYEFHASLLGGDGNPEAAPADILDIAGISNHTLLCMGEIAELQAWKVDCVERDTLDLTELVHRASLLTKSLTAHSLQLEAAPITSPKGVNLLHVSLPSFNLQRSLVTRIWNEAALLFLKVVVSGWNCANADVHIHVSHITNMLIRLEAPVLLRAVVWPFTLAGCLAESAQEIHFRRILTMLQPRTVWISLHKAFEMMQAAWRVRDMGDTSVDLSVYFRGVEELVFLV